MTDETSAGDEALPFEPVLSDPGGMDVEEREPGAIWLRRWWWALLAVVVIGLGVLTAALMGAFSAAPEPAPSPTPTAVAQPSPTPTPTPSATPTPSPSPEGPVVITDVRTMSYSPVWNPPDRGQSFWQIVDPDHGYPASGGTDFILGHACSTGDCAGDEFRRLQVGDTLTYKGETYEVQDRRSIWKSEIAEQDIWYHDPDRIVLITCIIEVAGVRAEKNDLFIATRL